MKMNRFLLSLLAMLVLCVPASAQYSGYDAARGAVPFESTETKFGMASDADSTGGATDVWDGADTIGSATGGKTWVAPTTARIHNLKSSQAADDADTGGGTPGTGAWVTEVYGLTSWDAGTEETTELVTMNGTSNVATVNAYVIIYRMHVYTAGSGGTNAGYITATAATDATVTAAIQASTGQTTMAIYGIPTGKTAYIDKLSMEVLKATGSTAYCNGTLQVKKRVDQTGALFHQVWVWGCSGNSPYNYDLPVPIKVQGPAILKINGYPTVDNSQLTAAMLIRIREE